MSLDELLALDVYHRGYEKALSVITQYCMALDNSQTDASVMALFDRWLYNHVTSLPALELDRESEYEMWTNLLKYDDLRPLARTAVRLISVGASESNVERLISSHRYLVHDRMTNLSPEVLLCRLQLQARAIAEQRQRKEVHQ